MLRCRLRGALSARRSFATASAAASSRAWEPIETKWQKRWAQQELQTPTPNSSSSTGGKDPFYCLAMFPYPSGECCNSSC